MPRRRKAPAVPCRYCGRSETRRYLVEEPDEEGGSSTRVRTLCAYCAQVYDATETTEEEE